MMMRKMFEIRRMCCRLGYELGGCVEWMERREKAHVHKGSPFQPTYDRMKDDGLRYRFKCWEARIRTNLGGC